ncbi:MULTISPECIES: uroporphyrinogen-III synthase [unclassified Rhizobium]|uniref:uroporphyrinogen-III synthase n=1 Tax=unclassified Rhizobium TaxID=2613769 RepID=UPI001AD9EE8C|nr:MULTISPECIES: uroporphyrinogen-III synthase [unclassified Rhizobium]MBO9125993.1 uroporphyrinogen-III synthase [Rhizobium sp. 16-488-2b]MBO9176577.1 uroporphyrinogen-III synthase [Rhizobium sp. 16-488-2a]
MRVLVTRPPHPGERTAKRLAEMGHEPIMLPLSAPAHDPDAAFAALANSDGPISVTSAEAIRVLTERPDDLAPYLSRPLYAVGDATAEEARAAGFRNVTASTGDGADLADRIAQRDIARSDKTNLLYLAGFPRAETFETRAAALGLTVETVECYRMRRLDIPDQLLRELFSAHEPDAILFYSRRTAEDFFALKEISANLDALIGVRLLCLSQAIAEAIPVPLQGQSATPDSPDETALLSLL